MGKVLCNREAWGSVSACSPLRGVTGVPLPWQVTHGWPRHRPGRRLLPGQGASLTSAVLSKAARAAMVLPCMGRWGHGCRDAAGTERRLFPPAPCRRLHVGARLPARHSLPIFPALSFQGVIDLEALGKKGYSVPKAGTIQVVSLGVGGSDRPHPIPLPG